MIGVTLRQTRKPVRTTLENRGKREIEARINANPLK
jgi:hypothetical protein